MDTKIYDTVELRVRKIIKDKDLSYAEAARMFGITKGAVSLWGKGVKIRWSNLEKVIKKYPDVSLEWLIRGKGKQYLTDVSDNSEELKKTIIKLQEHIAFLEEIIKRDLSRDKDQDK